MLRLFFHFLEIEKACKPHTTADRLNSDIAEFVNIQPIQEDKPAFKRGMAVGVKSSRGWFRGEIISPKLSGSDSFNIYYVDYGFKQVHHNSELVKLPRVLIDRHPAQVRTFDYQKFQEKFEKWSYQKWSSF